MKHLNKHQDNKIQQIKIIYLSMLCRQPTDKEIQFFKRIFARYYLGNPQH